MLSLLELHLDSGRKGVEELRKSRLPHAYTDAPIWPEMLYIKR